MPYAHPFGMRHVASGRVLWRPQGSGNKSVIKVLKSFWGWLPSFDLGHPYRLTPTHKGHSTY